MALSLVEKQIAQLQEQLAKLESERKERLDSIKSLLSWQSCSSGFSIKKAVFEEKTFYINFNPNYPQKAFSVLYVTIDNNNFEKVTHLGRFSSAEVCMKIANMRKDD